MGLRLSQSEYELVYMGMFPNTTKEEYNVVWDKIDADHDGNLTVKELATYYGFAWDDAGGVASEMSDEQILEALQVRHTHRSTLSQPQHAARSRSRNHSMQPQPQPQPPLCIG